ncbi:MAG: N-acetylglucosamine-6-phosphate deacetylase [Gemmataceae bacterium]
MLLRAKHYQTSKKSDITFEHGVIKDIGPVSSTAADFEAQWVAPAFFDLQINGCGGFSFNSSTLTLEQIRSIAQTCREHGIGAFCPTLITNSFEALAHGFETLRQAREHEPYLSNALPAFHLEGPYISPEDGPRGAHPKEHVRPPDWDEFAKWQDHAGGCIRLVTLAPEWPESPRFIEQLVDHGVVVAIGHTTANSQQIQDAISAGAKLSTHLGNGAHGILPRHPNYIWDQLAADELQTSLICDGFHLPPAVVKCFLRVKTPERLILTCDASSLAGLPPGQYQEWGQSLEVSAEGKVVVSGTPYLAGSGVFLDSCVRTMLELTDATLFDVLAMATNHPRELLDLPVPSIEVGQRADLILFDHDDKTSFHLRRIVPSQ